MSLIKTSLRHLGRSFWIVFGVIALTLGVIGAVLPVLPTTPLVILAAFSFAKGSPRLARMLEEHRIFGPIIWDWREQGAIAPRFKIIAIAMMAAALLLSLAAGVSGFVIAVQVACMSAAAAYILTRPNGV